MTLGRLLGRSHTVLLCCLGAAGLAAGAPAAAEQSAELHLLLQGTERFQKNVLDLEAQLLQAERDIQHPATGRASFFLNTALGGRFHLENIRLELDGDPLLEHRYNASERHALAEGATQPLHIMNLPPGKHELQAHFTVREGDKRHRGRSRLAFEHGKSETWLELLIEDVPDKIYGADGGGQSGPEARRVELSARAWEAPQ